MLIPTDLLDKNMLIPTHFLFQLRNTETTGSECKTLRNLIFFGTFRRVLIAFLTLQNDYKITIFANFLLKESELADFFVFLHRSPNKARLTVGFRDEDLYIGKGVT